MGFNPCFNGCRSAILLSLDIPLILVGFNPCFNGCRSAISGHAHYHYIFFCFNPCFNGCRSAIPVVDAEKLIPEVFQSLF